MIAAAPRPVQNDDQFRLRWLDDPQISPDGRRIAFTLTRLDPARDALTSSVYVCAAESSAQAQGRGTWQPVGPEGVATRGPRWAPDGERLSVLGGAPGAEQLWVMHADGSKARPIATGVGTVTESGWSPDGQRILFTAAGETGRQLWSIGADGTGCTRLSDGRGDDSAPAWSPDGTEIAFLSRRGGPLADIWVMPAVDEAERGQGARPSGTDGAQGSATGAARRLTHGAGPIRTLAWSPDARWLAYIGHAQGHAQGVNQRLYVMVRDGSGARELAAAADRSVGLVVRADDLRGMEPPCLAWSRDGSRVYFAFADGGTSQLGWAALDGRSGVAVGGERACLAFSVASREDRIAFVASDPLNPGEVYTATGDGLGETRVTACNDAWLGEVTLSAAERMPVRCDDGLTIDAWLMRPPGWTPGRRYPLILQIHGGPHYPLGERFYFEFQRLAAQGYIILYANPRGSQGYGEQFATSIRGAWGGRDFHDLMQIVDAAVQHEGVDAARLAVTGVSYGGYMTQWIIGHTARFRAAISENGISNLTSNFATSVHGAEFWEWEMRGTPQTEPERYRALSPVQYADAIQTPLLLIHAEQDANCAIAQSEEMHAALAARGRTSAMVRIRGEGHLMNLEGRPSARRLRAAAIDAWLAERL